MGTKKTAGLPVALDVPVVAIAEPPEGVQSVFDPETGVTTYLLSDGAVDTHTPPYPPPFMSWDQDMARMCQCGHTNGKHTQIIMHPDGKVTGGICCGTGPYKDTSDCLSKCQMFTEVVTVPLNMNGGTYGTNYGGAPTVLDYGEAFPIYKKKEKIKKHTEAQLEDVGNWLWQVGDIKKTVIQGHDLRDICIAYAIKATEELTANFDATVEKAVEKAVQKRMDLEKKQHKAKCIPSYKKNGRKFRDDNG